MKPAWTTRSMSKVEAVRGVKPMKRSSERDEAYESSCWNTLSMSKVEAVRGVKPMKPAIGPLYLCLR